MMKDYLLQQALLQLTAHNPLYSSSNLESIPLYDKMIKPLKIPMFRISGNAILNEKASPTTHTSGLIEDACHLRE